MTPASEQVRWTIADLEGFPDNGNRYVIPDVIWISHELRAQLTDGSGHLTGAPELIVEVLSNIEKDKKRARETKLKLYSIQGVC